MGSAMPTWLLLVLVFLSSVGLLIAARALFSDQARGRKRCPSCWYDVSVILGASRCPECGQVLSELNLADTRRHWGVATLGVALATVPWTFLHPGVRRQIVRLYTPVYTTTAKYAVNGYTAMEQTATDPMAMKPYRVVIHQGRRVVYDTNKDGGEYFYHNINASYAGVPAFPVGSDITGDGVPDLVVSHDTGGSGCGAGSTVFQIGGEKQGGFKKLADLPCGRFQDVDGDGLPEFIAADTSFAYKWTSGAESPYPEVVMKFKGGAYVVDVELMKKPAPLYEQIRQLVLDAEFKFGSTSHPPAFGLLLRTCLDLIYSGNEQDARRLLHDCLGRLGGWNADRSEKLVRELDEALKDSPFAKDIEPLRQPPK